jgi:hypothetical protein
MSANKLLAASTAEFCAKQEENRSSASNRQVVEI